jgi:signal transduction histidine kinase
MPLAEMVWHTARDGSVSDDLSPPPLPVGLLLDNLRHDLLEELELVADRVAVPSTVRLLQAVDSVADRLSGDPSHRFVARFLGAAGLEALVEVAHDMRSPLSSIVLLVETMRMGQSGPVTPVQERQLALVYGAAFGLSLMANDVIELARGDERTRELTALPFSISGVMQSVKEIVLPIAEEKELNLEFHWPAIDWRVGNSSALHRVLLNLTTNALKYTDAGFVDVQARQTSRTEVEFSVTDSGTGIPEHLQAALFDAFRDGEGTGKVTFSSSGLGLAICKRLVRVMGGEITGENTGSGSTFRFTLTLPPADRF